MPRVVEGLEDDAAGQGAVADDGHAVPFRLAEQLVRRPQSEAARDAAPGVARHEQIERAFVRVGITHEPALRADRLELLVATGDELVRVDLMPGVPDEPVLREIEA